VSHYLNFDKGIFLRGHFKDMEVALVADEEPEYLQYLLNKDDLRPPLEYAEREVLIEALESVGE
jgi:hypothetical protein